MSRACENCREALSARLDGEPSMVTGEQVDAHLAVCSRCSSYAARLEDVHRRVRVSEAALIPDLTASILDAVGQEEGGRARLASHRLRTLLALTGLVQLALAIPVLAGMQAGGIHVARELGGWELALGLAFLFTAWQPARAAGLLPFAAAVAVVSLVLASGDLVLGRTALLGELSHLVEPVGVTLLWLLSRRDHDRPVIHRRARAVGA